MRIKWENIVALGLCLFALIVVLSAGGPIKGFLSGMSDIGPSHTPDEQAWGLIAFGLVLAAILGLVKIMESRSR